MPQKAFIIEFINKLKLRGIINLSITRIKYFLISKRTSSYYVDKLYKTPIPLFSSFCHGFSKINKYSRLK
jgi:hypothetical protein